MKKFSFALALMATLVFTACEKEKKIDKAALQSDDDKVSYAVGYDIGKNMKKQGVSVNVDAFKEGVKNAFKGETSLLTEEEVKTLFAAINKKNASKREAESKNVIEKNKKEGKEFLDKKKKEAGVKETASGLLYKVIKEGSGEHPKASSQVTVNYKGTVVSGQEFDSTSKEGKPVSFPLNQLIKGWQEGIQLMSKGAKYELYIKPELAYGEQQKSEVLTPYSTLIFEIELVDFK
ncbi:MAG: FKBP-type peptidyl-prolyl cis-trans isomerase [Candidatus Sericytochromatia bacterium]